MAWAGSLVGRGLWEADGTVGGLKLCSRLDSAGAGWRDRDAGKWEDLLDGEAELEYS